MCHFCDLFTKTNSLDFLIFHFVRAVKCFCVRCESRNWAQWAPSRFFAPTLRVLCCARLSCEAAGAWNVFPRCFLGRAAFLHFALELLSQVCCFSTSIRFRRTNGVILDVLFIAMYQQFAFFRFLEQVSCWFIVEIIIKFMHQVVELRSSLFSKA